ncbi:activated protein kinase catalytic subunit alpha-1 [Seminavis robusta]|uniref:Guanylate cyclase n=1 Tax=Seminavis robusta TaxID=568900 RepID=A0A9N8E3U5_9STRA|nr:activated protein kinase catalytic subunit alpha-1 [Seminavis robusta]|eukprot:Sro474_g150250.1 activated protein kinase catalytic subunit alpha-1 (1134) ;mRNA; f:36772-40912
MKFCPGYLWLSASVLLLNLSNTCEAATVSIRRSAVDSNFLESSEHDCLYNGEILLSHPLSLGVQTKHYDLAMHMLRSIHLTMDRVNGWPRCGVSVDGKNFSLAIQTYGDEGSVNKTLEIGSKIVNTTDFLLSGYSSTLVRPLAQVAQENKRLMVTGGSASSTVYEGRDHVFGIIPPSGSFRLPAFPALVAAGARTFATIGEESTQCSGTEELAIQFGFEFVGSAEVVDRAPLEDFQEAARNISKLDPDVVMCCIRSSYSLWNKAMRSIDWSPKAQVYSSIFGRYEFEQELGTDLAYNMGTVPWERALPPITDGATGLTPLEFYELFEEATSKQPPYQAVSHSSAISVLVQAIERAGTMETEKVRDTIASGFFPTIFGNVSFDENGQNKQPSLLLQYDGNSKLQLLSPQELKTNDFQMIYPMPTWAMRDCINLSPCTVLGGSCTMEGSCQCPDEMVSVGLREEAECVPPELAPQEPNYAAIIGVPLLAICLIGLGLFWYMKTIKTRADAIWKINKEELIFADPAEVIGSGSFGEVLLAEYRGTKVAVKHVLPSKNLRLSGMDDTRDTLSLDDSGDDIEQPKKKRGHSSWGMASIGLSSTTSKTGMQGRSGSASGRSSFFGRMTMFGSSANGSIDLKAMKADFIREMRYLSKLRHPCITMVMGAVIESKEDPMLVMEYMDNGSLYDILHNETFWLDGEILLPLLKDISQGCRFLHAADPAVVHGDLKSANILVDSKYRAKVADFGLSQKQQAGGAMSTAGSPFWMAPELLRRESSNTTASDVYAFGIILYECFSRKDPYEGDDLNEILRQVADPSINRRPPVPKDCPHQLAALMADCVAANPDDRPSFAEIDSRLNRLQADTLLLSDKPIMKNSSVSLFDIFPKHIAEALRDGRKVEAEHHEVVTIFFCDIVGFTGISQSLEPQKVANMLDRLYSKFDDLSTKHDIFKVETIGDAYMAVTNLVKDQSATHATRIAQFSVEALKAANETLVDVDDHSKGYVNIRVGFHSGPVVSDVVGNRNPRYCLFGDAVNTASRMESNSQPNCIHCSFQAAELLTKQGCEIPLTYRGKINVKGKGRMETYWVNKSRKSAMTVLTDVTEEMSSSHADNDELHAANGPPMHYLPRQSPAPKSAVDC